MLQGFFSLVIWMLILGLVVWLLTYIIGLIPGLPGPIKSVVTAVIYVVAAIIVLGWLINMVGGYLPAPGWPALR